MTYADICEAVAAIKRKYDETDPCRLCRALGIMLILHPMGKDPDAVKGFFLESKRIRTITINSDLPEIIQRIMASFIMLCFFFFAILTSSFPKRSRHGHLLN